MLYLIISKQIMMKIAFIVGGFPKLSETFILNQITGLIDRGHEVDIYAHNNTNEDKVHSDIEKYSLTDRISYFRQPSNKGSSALSAIKLSLSNLYKNPTAILNSWNYFRYDRHRVFSKFLLPHMVIPFLENNEYDIVNCHFGYNGLKAIYLKQIGILKGKIVTTFHGLDITNYLESFGKDVYEQLFDLGDLFLPISDLWKKRLIELGCDPNKIVVHHMGIDCDKFLFQPRSLNSNDRIRFVTVSRLVEKKGVEYAIRAIAKLANTHRNIQYSIVGDGPLKEELQQLTKELNVEETVKLLGWKDRQEVIEILNQADIMLAPSVTSKNGDMEGIPVGIMEAMAVGLPVVSTYHSGIPELIEDGVSGFLVPERNVEALTQKLDYMIHYSEICEKISVVGRRYVEKFYDVNKLNTQLVDTYQNILKLK